MLNLDGLLGGARQQVNSTTTAADWQLIQAVAAGDEPALVELYRRYNVMLYSYLLNFIHEKSVAEDLLQETFLCIWKQAGNFRREASVKNWFFKIARNQAVSWLRSKEKKQFKQETTLARAMNLPDLQLKEMKDNEHIYWAVEQLSDGQRAVIELSFAYNMTYAEISEVLDCPVGTVKSRMNYALGRLKQLLRR